ncbi:MAG: 30S ribosomal protein S17e [Candidatus Bathyarchaeota archaeon]|nr:30S ribosomal protein S17e [Candidatus Bathyarchaeota archaeon]
MGKVKTEQIKRIGKELMKLYPTRFSSSFDDNKRMVNLLARGVTKRVRNQIAGYITQALASAGANPSSETEEET